MFMYHNDINNLGDGRYYAKGWRGSRANSADEVAKLITSRVASNCMWAHGIRKKANFVGADWLGLDFDDGMTLDDARIAFADYLHIIGTTKSHQIDKGGKRCDRFRVFIKFANSCMNKDDYEFTVKQWVNKYGADKACVDAARFFWPCKEIVVAKHYGGVIQVLDSSQIVEARKKSEKKQQKFRDHYKKNGGLPSWIEGKLEEGCASNMRNKVTYMIARELYKLGYSTDRIVDKITRSAIPSCGDHEFTDVEIRRTVQSAMRG